METIFTPSEAAAFVQLPAKQVYSELEYRVIPSVPNSPSLPFAALIYLRALKEVNFTFSVDYRSLLYQRLVEALEQRMSSLEIGQFFTLHLDAIAIELSDIITRFKDWEKRLVTDSNIMGGETVFPNSRLTVRRVGAMLERGESSEVIGEDYPYLSQEDLEFAQIYVKAYPSVSGLTHRDYL